MKSKPPKSRQRIWQIQMESEGRCIICGKKAKPVRFCAKHHEESMSRSRKRYRSAHGIPINAPVNGAGRKRLTSHGFKTRKRH